METSILPATDLQISRFTKLAELAMFRKTWGRAIANLQREKSCLLLTMEQQSDETGTARVVEIEYRIAIYEMCIDHANEREELLDARPRPDREANRERFFRLMAAMAKSANDRSEADASADFAGFDPRNENAWSPERWGAELEAAATSVRKLLVKAPD